MDDIVVPCLTGTQTKILIEAAEQTARRFCAPVYLVGSAIDSEFPNDIDIFITVNEETYLRLFTNYGRNTESEEDHLKNSVAMKLQVARIGKKQKAYFESKIDSWDFDVKFQVLRSFLIHSERKVVRLDAVYKELW